MTRLGALAHPPFARLLSGQLVSSAGTQMSNTAGAWVLYRLTHSALALGLQGLRFSAPIAVLPLLTGVLADRFSRLALVRADTMVQQAIPDALRGRISALGSAGQNGLAGLAAAATAGLAAAFGPGRAVTGLAVTTASAGLLLILLTVRGGGPPPPSVRPMM